MLLKVQEGPKEGTYDTLSPASWSLFAIGITLVGVIVTLLTNPAFAQTAPDGYNAICLTSACTHTHQ